MKKAIDSYFAYPLDAYSGNFDQRFLHYLVYGFLIGATTFISLNVLGLIRGYPVIQAFQGMYSWHTTLNFSFSLVLVAELFHILRSRNRTHEPMTVTHLWWIGLVSFLIAFFLQRTVVYAGVKNYNPTLIQYYNQYPDARPMASIMFVWCFLFWAPVYLFCSRVVIWKQEKFQKHAAASQNSKTERWVLDGGKVIINIDDISHVSMEDHYARIWWHKNEKMCNSLVRLSMKEVVNQLPEGQFIQIHRSHLINSSRAEGVVRINQKWSVTINGTELPISRTRLAEVRSKLQGEKGCNRPTAVLCTDQN